MMVMVLVLHVATTVLNVQLRLVSVLNGLKVTGMLLKHLFSLIPLTFSVGIILPYLLILLTIHLSV